MSALARAVRGAPEKRANGEFGDSTPPAPGQSPFLGGMGFVNESTPLTIAAALSCMSLLADAVSTLPLEQFRESSKTGQQAEKIDPSPVIADPFVEITQQDWITQEMMSLLLSGDGLGEVIERDRRGFALQVMPQPARPAKVTRAADGAREYTFAGKAVAVDDVFHMRAISLPGELRGLSPIGYLRRTFAIGIAAEQYAESFYNNSGSPNGVLQGESGLTEEDVRITAQSWKAAHGGAAKAGLPAVLSGVTWQQVSLDAGDALFLDQRAMTDQQMVMLYRVPPHMVGIVDRTTSWGTGIEQQEMGFVRNTLVSWARRFEIALSALLPPGQFVKFDFSHRLRGDSLQRAQAAALHRANGTRNIDELRAVDDLPPLPDGLGQDYLQPLNYVAIGSAAAAAIADAGTQPAPVSAPVPPPE